jgi:carboxyl-terminal processing protease
MKKIIFTICILFLNCKSEAQTSKDSIQTFYNVLFKTLESDYLYKNDVKWNEVEATFKNRIAKYDNFTNSLKEITPLFDEIKATHCTIFYNEKEYLGTDKEPTEKDFSKEWVKKYVAGTPFEAKVLDEKYGYILMPGLLLLNNSYDTLHTISQKMYDQISKIKQNKIDGWIIDLRFNTGGSCYPMLLALYDFLGDSKIWGELDINKKIKEQISLSKGKYYNNQEIISFINPKGQKLTKNKIAVITGIVTASAGEDVAISFKGRKNTIFIGENTNGKTTSNSESKLPFGAVMALTTGYVCDRNNEFYEKIIPDVKVSKEDNFENLILDKNIIEAIIYFRSKK